jgi:dihydrofolate reductase
LTDAPFVLIAAMSADRVIGDRGRLPWDLPEEYAQFVEQVRGHAVVIGRVSFEIFGADLDPSRTVVVRRDAAPMAGVEVRTTVDAALGRARGLAPGPVFCAGGATVYALALPLADRLHLSIVHGRYRGDARFPAFDEAEWSVAVREDRGPYEYREYVRRG